MAEVSKPNPQEQQMQQQQMQMQMEMAQAQLTTCASSRQWRLKREHRSMLVEAQLEPEVVKAKMAAAISTNLQAGER